MSNKDIIILAVESSCDDTSAAVLINGKIHSNITAGQEVHKIFGGVVPELASRAHQSNILPVVDTALKTAGIDVKNVSAIAFTRGPGLPGSLIVGTGFSKSLALALNIPLIEVHHMQAHILAHFIEKKEETKQKPEFPFLCLTVSGGHTQIVLVRDFFDFEIIGQTIDDAAGEAFDKSAKIMGLPYPGGPLIDQYAKLGDATKFKFAKPKAGGYNYSFSGLKTSILYFLQKQVADQPNFIQENLNDLCASIQSTIIDILLQPIPEIAAKYNVKSVALAGGVSANSELRKKTKDIAQKLQLQCFIPAFEYCTDNAAMIAQVGWFKYLSGDFSTQAVQSSARLNW